VKTKHNITVSWVLGHSGIQGNEIAHSLASNLSDITNNIKIKLVPTYDSLKISVKSTYLHLWSLRYAALKKGSGLKVFFPELANILGSKLTKTLSPLTTSLLTGHGRFYYHSHRIGLPSITECPSCQNPDFSIPHQILH